MFIVALLSVVLGDTNRLKSAQYGFEILLLSYVIPISLRISLDFSKAYFCYEI